MNEMIEEFYRIATQLNSFFKISPLLFGSLGLGQLMEHDFNSDDIDILIPEVYVNERWDELKSLIEALGYTLIDLHEHEFNNGRFKVAFAELEGLIRDINISLDEIEIINSKGVSYKVLNLVQFLATYEYSAKDGYRRKKSNNKDLRKIECIKEAMGRT